MKLSIIICVYNTSEELFEKALESIKRETLNDGDYEILVIDDGSDKDYTSLITKYKPRYIKTENQGIFRARLLGIREARGEYIAFVDSDDSVSINYHRTMLDTAEKSGCDLVFNDWAFNTERTRYCCMRDSTISKNFDLRGLDILRVFAKNEGREHAYFVLWNKLFASSLLKNALDDLEPIALKNDKYNYSEDTLICFFAMLTATHASNIHTGYYFYRIHTNQTVNIISAKRLEDHIMCMSETLSTMIKKTSEIKNSDDIIFSFKKWQMLMSRTHFSHAKANGYLHLYDLIKNRYNVDKLKTSTFHDNSAYSDNRLIPENFEEIDKFLYTVFNSKGKVYVDPRTEYNYTSLTLDYINSMHGNIVYSKQGMSVPKPRIKLKNKILMNKFVYSLGLLIFKKGSKIRAFLKKHV